MAVDAARIDPQATLAKVRNRIMPLLIAAFVVSYVDRVNVGFAAITLSKDIGLTASMYGLGAGLVFFGYCIFELPSNLACLCECWWTRASGLLFLAIMPFIGALVLFNWSRRSLTHAHAQT